MRKFFFAAIAVFYLCGPLHLGYLMAQVQLGGHPYVPSTTDSTGGLTIIDLNNASPCNVYLAAGTPLGTGNCNLIKSSGGTISGADGPWNQTMEVDNSFGAGPQAILLPWSPGRSYTVLNNSGISLTIQAYDVGTTSASGAISTIPASQTTTSFCAVGVSPGGTQGFLPCSSAGSSSGTFNYASGYPCPTSTELNANLSSTDTTATVVSTACLNPSGGYFTLSQPQYGGPISSTVAEHIKYTAASGTTITGLTRGQFGSTAVAWTAAPGGSIPVAVVDGITALQANSATSAPTFIAYQDGAFSTGMDAGNAWTQPGGYAHGPSATSSVWAFPADTTPVDFIGAPCKAFGPNWDEGYWTTIRCDAITSTYPMGSGIANMSSANTAETIYTVGNDDASDGGFLSALNLFSMSTTHVPLGSESPTEGAASTHGIIATGGPLWIGSSEAANNIDPIIHIQYGVQQNGYGLKNTDDLYIDSTGIHLLDLAPGAGITDCVTVTGATGQTGVASGCGLGGTLSNSNCVIQSGTSLTSCTLVGSDANMQACITTGAGSTPSGPLVEINYTATRTHISYAVMQPIGALGITLYPTNPTAAHFYISDSGGMTSSTTYCYNISAP